MDNRTHPPQRKEEKWGKERKIKGGKKEKHKREKELKIRGVKKHSAVQLNNL